MIFSKMKSGNALMDVLCFDMGSGGIAGARFDEKLTAPATAEVPWDLHRDAGGRATLSAQVIESTFARVAQQMGRDDPPAAISIACFMHSFLLTDSSGAA